MGFAAWNWLKERFKEIFSPPVWLRSSGASRLTRQRLYEKLGVTETATTVSTP
jgi:hypothetical protein